MGTALLAASSNLTETMISALESGFGSIKTDFITTVGIALPVALGIFGICFGIRKAISFFKSSSG